MYTPGAGHMFKLQQPRSELLPETKLLHDSAGGGTNEIGLLADNAASFG